MTGQAPLSASRRDLLVGGAGAALAAVALGRAARALAAEPGTIAFQVWRANRQIGTHTVAIRAAPGGLVAEIAAQFVVSIGPVPVFHYRHAATETWRDGRFFSLDARSVSNGSVDVVHAERTGPGVSIRVGNRAPVEAPPDVSPLTHWNKAALNGPLFNPQTGALMPKEHVKALGAKPVLLADGEMLPAFAYDLTGEAKIIDWYDDAGNWAGLEARVMDGSTVQYRRT